MIDPRTEALLEEITGGRRLSKLADRLEKSCKVDAERYEFPSMSRE